MIIYHYSRETGAFTGVSSAQPNPEEPEKFLIPACATETAPPAELPEGHVHVFAGGAWTAVEDHRGKTIWHTETQWPSVIETLGPLPEGVTEIAPQPLQKWDATSGAWVTDDRAVILNEIGALEAQQTPRRLREAALGSEESIAFLQGIEEGIATKRAALAALGGDAE